MSSTLVGHTTLLISVLDSKTIFKASLPSVVVAATKRPNPETNITRYDSI